MRSKVTVQPALEPVTLSELKASLRITSTEEDALLTQYIEDARIYVERMTGRKLITQTIVSYYDGFSGTQEIWFNGARRGTIESLSSGERHSVLEFPPAQSITQVDTVDTSNAETVYASANYYLDNYDDDMRARMVLNYDASLSVTLRPQNNVKITYVAGYGDAASDVPSALKRAIIVLSGELYSNRGDCDTGTCSDKCGASAMIGPYTLVNTSGLR
mgnify:CR=1 FL=1